MGGQEEEMKVKEIDGIFVSFKKIKKKKSNQNGYFGGKGLISKHDNLNLDCEKI